MHPLSLRCHTPRAHTCARARHPAPACARPAAGVYGMNFDILPELHWPAGYAYFWAMCVTISAVFVAAMMRAGMVTSPSS